MPIQSSMSSEEPVQETAETEAIASLPRLVVHDKVEGQSVQARQLYSRLLERIPTSERRGIDMRPVDGRRRVTRDSLLILMEKGGVSEDERRTIWAQYFGGPPTDIADCIRREIILAGGIREYARIVGLTTEGLSTVMETRLVSWEVFQKLKKEHPGLLDDSGILEVWEREYEMYLQKKYKLNVLAARAERLFAMHPHASRKEWVDKDKPPASLKALSQNNRRILLQQVRQGQPLSWKDVDKVFFGMGCSRKERLAVAQAWLQVRREGHVGGQRVAGYRVHSDGEESATANQELYPEAWLQQSDLECIVHLLAEETGEDESVFSLEEASLEEALKRVLGEKTLAPVPSNGALSTVSLQQEEADNVVADDQLEVDKVAAIETGETAEETQTDRAEADVSALPLQEKELVIVDTADAVPNAQISIGNQGAYEDEEDSAVASDAIVLVDDTNSAHTRDAEDGEEELAIILDEDSEDDTDDSERDTDDDDEEEDDEEEESLELLIFGEEPEPPEESDVPIFSEGERVWSIGESVHNFTCTSAAGYTHHEEGFTVIAQEVANRASMGFNNFANALKLLAYSYGRYPDHQATYILMAALAESRTIIDTKKLMALLIEEPRFSAFMAHYRDTDPDSPLTSFFASLMDLESCTVKEGFDDAETEVDYEERIHPQVKEIEEPKAGKRKPSPTSQITISQKGALKAQLKAEIAEELDEDNPLPEDPWEEKDTK